MSDTKHTPGPWNQDDQFVRDASGLSIAHCGSDRPGGKAIARANATLIAAAPDLLAACDELQACFLVTSQDNFAKAATNYQIAQAVLKVRAAIAKANQKPT